MYKNLVYFFLGISVLMSCSGPDVGFVNEVKTFSPQWMDLNERVSFLRRNFKFTANRYGQDIVQLSAAIENAGASTRSKLYGRRAEYRKIVSGRDKLAVDFEELYKRFEKQNLAFHQWEKKLMEGDFGKKKAQEDFLKHKKDLKQLQLELTGLQRSLSKNILQHNKVLSQITDMLGLYTNFKIELK